MTINYIIIQSCKFDTKNKNLIKKEGVVFTSLNICNEIIEKLKPKITDTICEPSVGKGIFIFALLEWFRKKGENIESIKCFVENNLWCYDINADFINEFQDRVLFGTDSCHRSDVNKVYPNVDFIRKLREEKIVDDEIIEKIEWKNCTRLLNLENS